MDKIEKVHVVLTDSPREVYTANDKLNLIECDLSSPGSVLDQLEKLAFSDKTFHVVALESIHAFVQDAACIKRIALFLTRIRTILPQGLVLMRFNPLATAVDLTTVLKSIVDSQMIIETPFSISTYPLIERKRYPSLNSNAAGLCIVLRRNQAGKIGRQVQMFDFDEKNEISWRSTRENPGKETKPCDLISDVSFKLDLSEKERQTREAVDLPYEHHGEAQMLYMDPDDLEWDDDDLDHDLDI